MTTVECLAALVGAVLGWKAGGLLNHLHSMRPPAILTIAEVARPAGAASPSRAPASEPGARAELTGRARSA